jgi:hypothetical protein
VEESIGESFQQCFPDRLLTTWNSFEMKNLRVVHFLIKNHLDRGYNSGSGIDTLAKNLGEWVRCRKVEVPERFLKRGRI